MSTSPTQLPPDAGAARAPHSEATVAMQAPPGTKGRGKARSGPKGRQPDADALTAVQRQLGPRGEAGLPAHLDTGAAWPRDRLIEWLHRLNDAQGALREGHLVALARLANLPMAEVYEVATFYHHFDVVADGAEVPPARLRVCDGLSCRLAGAEALLRDARSAFGPLGVAVEAAPCIGRCEAAPATWISRHGQGQPEAARHAAVAPASVEALRAALNAAAAGAAPAVKPTSYDDYRATGGYALAAALARGQRDTDSVLKAIEDSGLRGLGGAGFPAGRKWRIVRAEAAPRLMAVNIDEGEPGTFKDRWWLERDPHRFLEGVLIAARVVGIDSIWLYLRDEYPELRALLARSLAELQADPPCALPRIELRRGAGAYICGEESAMIESIEGKRGEPRMRPPYIAQVGLFGRPTLEHNAETLYWVREIVERGADWWASAGRNGRSGWRSFSVSGRVREPGVKLAPAGITLRELIDEFCGGVAEGHALYAYLPGGASGGILPARLADVPLDFDTIQPHGGFIGSAAIVVLSQADRARDAALDMMRFFADESCGQCTPCRVGTAKAVQLMRAPAWDHATLNDLNQVMADASICGLGQAAPNPVRSVQRYFADEVGGLPVPSPTAARGAPSGSAP